MTFSKWKLDYANFRLLLLDGFLLCSETELNLCPVREIPPEWAPADLKITFIEHLLCTSNSLLQALCMFLFYSLNQHNLMRERNAVNVPIFLMRKVKRREIRSLVWDLTVWQWQSQDFHSGCLVSETALASLQFSSVIRRKMNTNLA